MKEDTGSRSNWDVPTSKFPPDGPMSAKISGDGRRRRRSRLFRCREFSVAHDRCKHKVGTDSVILGAWMISVLQSISGYVNRKFKALDIGTGCGILALILAQKCSEAMIDAVDSHKPSYIQAQENFAASKFSRRLTSHFQKIQDFVGEEKKSYDIIASNPPFFFADEGRVTNSLPKRLNLSSARHSVVSLPLDDLFRCAAALLSPPPPLACRSATSIPPKSMFFCVFPSASEAKVRAAALKHGLVPYKVLRTVKYATTQPVRTFAAFTQDSSTKKKLEERNNANVGTNNDNDDQNDAFTREKKSANVSFDSVLERCISVRSNGGANEFSEEYVELTKDYYYKDLTKAQAQPPRSTTAAAARTRPQPEIHTSQAQ